MGKLGQDMIGIASQITLPQRDYLDARARNAGCTAAEAIRTIFNFWLAVGAPPLTDHELTQEIPDIPKDAGVCFPNYRRSVSFKEIPAHWAAQFTPGKIGDQHGPILNPVDEAIRQRGKRKPAPKATASDASSGA